MSKLRHMVTICFPFKSYKFQYQPSSLHTVVSICVRDFRSVFHRVFFWARTFRCQRDSKFVNPGTTVNVLYYKTVLQKVKKAVKKKRGSDHHWFLLHDNASSHCSLIVQQYLRKKAVTAIPHAPYSPD